MRVAAAFLFSACFAALTGAEPVVSLEPGATPPNLVEHNVAASTVEMDGAPVLRVEFGHSEWPNVLFTAEDDPWDWSEYIGLAVDVYNPGERATDIAMRIDNDGADGMNFCVTGNSQAPPGEWTTFTTYFLGPEDTPFWGMRGVPEIGPLGQQSPDFSPEEVVAFQVFLPRPDREYTLNLRDFRLVGAGGFEAAAPMPFVDRFGQYKHGDWPGKVKDEGELAAARDAEALALANAGSFPGRSAHGGWAGGPKLEATGWFRTAEHDGRRYLVTPEGHLFFSMGVNCVTRREDTWVDGREDWFDWLPDPEGLFGAFYSERSGAHSMAEVIGGEGRAFSFYSANLRRKYGGDWRDRWRETAYDRLAAWGFNTIANWSDGDVYVNSPMPYTASINIWGDFRRIEGGSGYWAEMVDVFDPAFAAAVDARIASAVEPHAENPLCIGYFVDNELSWGGAHEYTIPVEVLQSPPDQPARETFIDALQERHGTLDAVNEAWAVDAPDWDNLRAPGEVTEAAREDLAAFLDRFARRYFRLIREAMDEHAPNQLYLGCRFAGAPHRIVLEASADLADVVSLNLYQREIDCAQWCGEDALDAPLIIGEFHFGALDRGMFHTGLVATDDQAARAAAYQRYLESVAACPAFVGAHWFQYFDQPITGRWYDGENYNIGFVTVTDRPHPELVRAAQETHRDLHALRAGVEPTDAPVPNAVPSAEERETNVTTGFINKTMTVDGEIRDYVVYLPKGYEPGEPMPVILFLHGAGERGNDGMKQSDVGIGRAIRFWPERFPAIVVMPQCPEGGWWDRDIHHAETALEETLKAYAVDKDRIYLTGLSMGGYGAWMLAAKHPYRFAAVMPICGGGDPDDADKLARTPIWAFHGEDDPVVVPQESRRMVEAVREAGGLVKYTEYPDTGHNSWDAAYSDPEAIAWLFKQHRGARR